MKTTIRMATLQDAAIIVRLITELAASIDGSSPISEDYVKIYLSSPSSKILLAEKQGQAIGLLSYSLRPDLYHAAETAYIEELVVLEEFRSQGVGSALIREVFSRLAASGCAEVSVAVMQDNSEAIRFYRANGLTDEAVYLEKHFDPEGTENLHSF